MLGKASEIKTVTVESSTGYSLHNRINWWLTEMPDAEVIDIKYAFAMTESERADSALIIYKEGESL